MTRRRIFKSILKNIGNPTISPCYNGNISSVFWRTAQNDASNALVSSPERGYLFTYDGLSRLKDAVYGEGTSLNQNRNRFNEQITGYDKMGNILGLLRYGQTGTDSYGLIDNLNLTYHGNQLQSVYDNATNCVFGNGMEFKDAAHETVEYAYDKNGNLTKDLNKKITEIQYNILNLPSHISFADGSSIEYEYAADGSKVRTTHTINDNVTSTVYCGNAIYENGSLKMLLNESGYYSFQDNKFHFYIKDHQGNVRVVADETGKVDEVNDYYPFGGLMSNVCNNVQSYKYNGKELDRKGGLDWYDYGARHYDAMIGRWCAVDSSSEKYYNWSPYTYCKNNPILRIDADGKDDYIVSNRGQIRRINATNRTVDVLYYAGSRFDTQTINPQWKNIRVFDKTFLKNFTQESNRGRDVNDPQYFGETSSLYDAANVVKFVMDNTEVEWSLDAGSRDGEKSYVVGTNHKEDAVRVLKAVNGNPFEGFETKVRIHSHPNEVGGTKGGSLGDIENAKGKDNVSFGVYFKGNQTLYEYNSRKSNVNEFKIDSLREFMKLINKMNK